MSLPPRFARTVAEFVVALSLLSSGLLAQNQTSPPAAETPSAPQPAVSLNFDMPKSHNPLKAYSAESVPEPNLTNSPDLDQLEALQLWKGAQVFEPLVSESAIIQPQRL